MEKDFDLVYQIIYNDTKKSGCYAINRDLLQQRPHHDILVPLKMSEYHLEIVNAIANVTLTQTYYNPTDKFLEMEYNFPVHPEACIYKFIAQFGNVRIEGVVKEKEEAKKQYAQALEQGRRVAYGQIRPESKDIMVLKVGNVPPDQIVRIEIAYLQELTLSCNTFYQLHMAGTITPRYTKYIPEQKIREALGNEASKSKGQFYWNFTVTLKTTKKVIFCDSHTHSLQLLSQNDAKTVSEFTMTKASIPNIDFTFSFTTELFHMPSSVYGRTDCGSTAMLSFIPKFCELKIDDAYKAAVNGKKIETDMDKARGEYIFLLDRSGSMDGVRMQKAKQALILFVKSLPQQIYFNVVSFGSSSEQMFKESVAYKDKTIKEAVNKIKGMQADLGGTEIHSPLEKILKEKPIDGYPRQIFLLTDGGVGDTTEVINMVARSNKHSRVHTIGIGNGASQSLILGCAKSGKGSHIFINDHENPSAKIIQLLSDSLTPLIFKMSLDFDKDLVEGIFPNPLSLPSIIKNEIVNFYITFKGHLEQPTKFKFSYLDSFNKVPYETTIEIDPTIQNIPFIDKMAHFKRIRLLQESLKIDGNVEDRMYFVKEVDKKAQIIKESVKHQILSEFTAFICVEKELVDGQYHELKDKGKEKVMIQNPKPRQYDEEVCENHLNSISRRSMNLHSYNTKFRQNCSQNSVQSASIQLCSAKSYQKKSGCMGGSSGPAMKSSAPVKKKQQKQKSDDFFSNIFSSPSLIDKIIDAQTSSGSWEDIDLIGLTLGKDLQKDIEKTVNKEDRIAVITYLICKWIEKHHPGVEYTLVVKKGLSFIRKQSKNIEELGQKYDKLVV